MTSTALTGEHTFRGIPVAPGVCRAKVLVLGSTREGGVPHIAIMREDFPRHTARLRDALLATRREIQDIQRQVNEKLGGEDASIFEAHLLVLEDQMFLDEVTRYMERESVNIEYAFDQVARKFINELGKIEDDYLRERAVDMRDVTSRILNHLLGRNEAVDLGTLPEPVVLVSHDISPSTTALLDKEKVLGFATDGGSKTSHTAIMARSLRIPAVVGLRNVSEKLSSGLPALLDGYNGVLIVNPTEQTLYEYGQIIRMKGDLDARLAKLQNRAAETLDGTRVMLSANIGQAGDAEAVIACGAEGVGLFRSEFLFINRDTPPSEEEQYEQFKRVAAALSPHPVIIRTVDLGGDKINPQTHTADETNPFMGWRAIRFCLQERGLFREHLRAILRASAAGNIKMMYPMISGMPEFEEAGRIVDECKEELRREGVPFNEGIHIGAMVEIPSAALISGELARKCKFLSLGTNDLIQYTLAVDRLNERVAHLYTPTHPAVLRLIKMTVDAAHAQGIWAGVCGEMAGDVEMVPLLLGLGVDELSVAPPLVPQVKYLIRNLKMKDAEALAAAALKSHSAEEIYERSRELARSAAPTLFEKITVS